MLNQPAQQAVLAGVGIDHTGIIDEVSHFLLERGVEIVETQLCNLRGAASFLLVISGAALALDKVRDEMSALCECSRMSLSLLPATPLQETAPVVGSPYRLVSRGRGQAGVVNRLSHLLRVLNVNIENFRIDTPDAASSAEFELNVLMSVPRETPVNMLRGYLEQLCGEIGISCDLKCA